MQELQQAVGLGMFRHVLGHLFQQGLGLTLDDRQFEEHGGVEHSVGIFLIGEYPLVLAGTYRRPAADGVDSRDPTILVVADDAAQQAVVGRGDIVVLVEQQGGQG